MTQYYIQEGKSKLGPFNLGELVSQQINAKTLICTQPHPLGPGAQLARARNDGLQARSPPYARSRLGLCVIGRTPIAAGRTRR